MAELAHQRGRFPDLEKDMEQMSIMGLRDLHRLIRNFKDDLMQERRTMRPFPGGPRIRC
jgi:hypothetical protein